ncbi:zinc finger protein 184-like isoform X2 [Folsomia candida]|uniref:zinc finger protein 184-like isoform X2 n=2 Tax=Folsomia candida TaxID=158441 RepID=UPI0016052A01|nr:zinc finger protein 184-like isoform X2 [Folsomia candida]
MSDPISRHIIYEPPPTWNNQGLSCLCLTMDQEVVPDTQQTGSHAKTEKIPPPSPEVDKSHLNQRPKLAKTWQKLGPLIATSVANRKMYDGYEIAVKNETYTCLACGFVISGSRKSKKSDNRRLIKLHIKAKHLNAFRCEPCEKDYTSYTILQTHLRKMHSAGKLPTHVCEICGKTVSNIELHVWNHHKSPEEKEQVIQSGVGFGLISCDKCGKEFSGHDKLAAHQTQGNRCKGAKISVENDPAAGTSGVVLGSADKSDTSLSKPSNGRLTCRICGRSVTFYSHAQHEWTHKNEAEKEESIRLGTSPKVRCHICNTYVLHSGYKAHLDVHKNPEEISHLVCEWDGCGRKFARKSYLALHIKTFHQRWKSPPVAKPKLDLLCPEPCAREARTGTAVVRFSATKQT